MDDSTLSSSFRSITVYGSKITHSLGKVSVRKVSSSGGLDKPSDERSSRNIMNVLVHSVILPRLISLEQFIDDFLVEKPTTSLVCLHGDLCLPALYNFILYATAAHFTLLDDCHSPYCTHFLKICLVCPYCTGVVFAYWSLKLHYVNKTSCPLLEQIRGVLI